jgi:thiamine-monophosphate kinase
MDGGKTLASLGEFGLIEKLLAPLRPEGTSGVVVGIGDDAAVINVPRTQQLLATTDTLVEGIHFTSDLDPYLLGQKTLRVNLSDIAAMGGLPRWALLSLSVPASTRVEWMEEFTRGLGEAAERFQVALVGGDTVASKGCITITLTLLGVVGQHRSALRSDAQAGDRLFVTGTVGDAALGLAHRQGRLKVNDADDLALLEKRHNLPEPRMDLAYALRDAAIARGAIDISDGLLADLGHMCRASGVGARIDFDHIPLSDPARRLLERHRADVQNLILTGGEDYELLFTVPPAALEQLRHLAQETHTPVREIGEMTTNADQIEIFSAGQPIKPPLRQGWTHF